MAAQMFQVDQKDALRLARFFLKAPAKFAVASGMMLNNFAFGTRDKALVLLPRKMTVRNKRFMERQIRVEKSHFRLPVESQKSTVGSLEQDRFTGWKEHETGEMDERKRHVMLAARKGVKARKVPPSVRLKSKNKFDNYSKRRKPFLVKKQAGHLMPGLYRRIKKTRLQLLQSLKPSKRKVKRLRWLETSRGWYFSGVNIPALWERTLSRYLKFKLQ